MTTTTTKNTTRTRSLTTSLAMLALLFASAGGAVAGDDAHLLDAFHLETGRTLRAPSDILIIAQNDIVIDGDIAPTADASINGYGITLISLTGDIIVKGALRGASGRMPLPAIGTGDIVAENGGAGGDITLLAPQGRITIDAGAVILAGSGANGGNAIATSVDAYPIAGDGGRAGNVLLAARVVEVNDAIVSHGYAGNGGHADALGAIAKGGDGAASGIVRVSDGEDSRLVRAGRTTFSASAGTLELAALHTGELPARQAGLVEVDLDILDLKCPPKGAHGTNEIIDKGGDGGCAYMKGADGVRGADGADGRDDTTVPYRCTDGSTGGPGSTGGAATATGGDGGNSYYGPGGDGGDATAVGGRGGGGGGGGDGGNEGPFGNGCNGGNGVKGANGGAATANGGHGGNSICQNGGDGGAASATGGSGGSGGRGGAPGHAPYGSTGAPGSSGTDGNGGGADPNPGNPGTGPLVTNCKLPPCRVCDIEPTCDDGAFSAEASCDVSATATTMAVCPPVAENGRSDTCTRAFGTMREGLLA